MSALRRVAAIGVPALVGAAIVYFGFGAAIMGSQLKYYAVELDAASRQALMIGATGAAADYVSQLLDKGFYKTEFLRYCAKYKLCD